MATKLFALLSLFVTVSLVTAVSNKERLVGDLLRGYIREIDPGNTPLRMGLSYICADLNTASSQLTSKLLEKYGWDDLRLKWTPSRYDGIEHIRLPAKMIWLPDVKLYNAHAEAEIRDDVNVIVYSNGSVIWIPMVSYKTRCAVDEDGSASCKIKIGSWTYDAINLALEIQEPGFDTFMYLDTCPYVISEPIVKVETQVYPCCPDPYASLDVDFKVRLRE